MEEEIVKGSISDLIFRIETLSSDRDTIKVCVRAAKELAWLESQLTKRALDSAMPCPDCGSKKLGIHSIHCLRYRPPSQ